MADKEFDVIVVGSGPAGYVAAIRCAQLGMSVACVEKQTDDKKKPVLGGTCLNVGCIPSKALLEASHKYHDVLDNYPDLGIKVSSVKLDLNTMMARKDGIVSKLTGGIAGLLKGNKVTALSGTAKLVSAQQIDVTAEGSSSSYQAKHVILASGSEPVAIPSVPYDGAAIVDSTGALSFTEVPKKLCIIGAGVIGLELGSVWSRLGSEVVILEAMPDFLPMVDSDISKQAYKDLSKQGLDIRLGCMVEKAKTQGSGKKTQVKISYKDSESKTQTITVDKVVVAVGRRPVTEDLFAQDLGIEKDKRGFIQVDQQCRTGLSNVFAVGDIVRGPMLAHKGSEEGVMVAEILAGRKTQINYDAIPNVIYTAPEVAWVGKTIQECDVAKVKVGTFPFAAIGRAMANNDTRGMVKVIADKETDQVLGIHIYGQHAGELVAQAVTSLEFMASSEDIALMTFAHPTLSEAVHEAALAVDGHAIHMVNRKKK